MASINDNLFTTLLNYTANYDVGCRIMTEWGPITAHFSKKGLRQLYFDDSPYHIINRDNVFRNAFLKWLESYQSLTPADRWKYLDPQGTDFQMSVWKALHEIPLGETVSYKTIAERIGNPKANRAVGTAVGANPISVIIPCHRAIQASGAIGNYRWGVDRKLRLLDAEQEAGSDLLRIFK